MPASSIPASPISQAPVKHLTYQELDILHALRGFCAFYVVIYHAKFLLWSGGTQYLLQFPRGQWGIWEYAAFSLDMLSAAGMEMVIFFFVLSGFFIRYAQLRKRRSALEFYLNRIVRIYPPFLVSALLAAAVLAMVVFWVPEVLNAQAGRELNETLLVAWRELLSIDVVGFVRTLIFLRLDKYYVGNNVVYWSLLPEALFYLSIPLVWRHVQWYYVISILALALGLILNRIGYFQNDITRFVFVYNVYFALGMWLYDTVTTTSIVERVRKIPSFIVWAALFGILGGVIILALLKWTTLASITSGTLAIMAILALLAGHVSARNSIVRVMHWLGGFSFSLYLYHYPLLIICYSVLVAVTGKLFMYERVYWLALPVVTLVSYGLYWVTERVSIKYFRKV